LELLQRQENDIQALKSKLQRAAKQAERGELLDGPQVMRELRTHARQCRERRAS
jgi:hypothetical protein